MITVENRFKDAKNEMPSAYQLSRYISVKQINNVFKWFMPYKFKTLIRLAPKGVKQTLYGMIDFLNCKNVVVCYDDEECQPVWEEDNIPIYNDTAMNDDNACFTYNNIDKSQIKLLDIVI